MKTGHTQRILSVRTAGTFQTLLQVRTRRPERASHLPKITQQVSGQGTETRIQFHLILSDITVNAHLIQYSNYIQISLVDSPKSLLQLVYPEQCPIEGHLLHLIIIVSLVT